MSRFGEAVKQAFFPCRCYLCGEVIYPHQRVCGDCVHHRPYIYPPICERCGRSKDDCRCGKRRRHFTRCVSPFYHRSVAADGIYALKNHGYHDVVEGFADEMAEVVRREYGGIAFDWVTSVPLHKKDQAERGFDQAQKLGQAVAKRLCLPYEVTLTKITHTAPQKELKAVQRSGNLLGVFDVCSNVNGKTILLVDDVITTGATLDECAKMLKIFGAAEVYGVTAAAAVLSSGEE